jgi:hypothetical protein
LHRVLACVLGHAGDQDSSFKLLTDVLQPDIHHGLAFLSMRLFQPGSLDKHIKALRHIVRQNISLSAIAVICAAPFFVSAQITGT